MNFTLPPRVRLIVIAVNVLAASFLMWFGVWLAYMEPPYLTYRNVPFPVLTPEVKAGDVVLIRVERCNSTHTKRAYITGRALIPHGPGLKPIEMQSAAASIRPGCQVSNSALNIVPPGTAPGRYHIEGVAEIAGTIRTHSVLWSSASFEVVP